MARADGRRRGWGLSGFLSLVAHGGVVVAGLLGATAARRPLSGHEGERALAVAIVDFELAPVAEAASVASEVPASTNAIAPPTPVVPRRGHAVRRSRPAPAIPVRLPETSDAIEPPPFVEAVGREGDSADQASEAVSASVGATVLATPAPVPTPPRVAAAIAPPEPSAVSPAEARYLRVYDTFPSLPRSLWVSGRLYAVIAQVCVTAEGRVSDVTIMRGAASELDRDVAATMRSWRYRPRLIQGLPRPFCHLMKLEFMLGR